MYDLHTHVLPGFDDGSPDLDTSLAMLRIAAEHGTTHIFATPHCIPGAWFPAWADITQAVDELNAAAAQHQLNIHIYPGAEVALDWSLLEHLKAPGPYCLNGSAYILVEMPLGHLPVFMDDFIFHLQSRGFMPILAHPERCPAIVQDPDRLETWVERGLLVQINAPSLNGQMGPRAQAAARHFLSQDWVQFIGSDAHGSRNRRPNLTSAKDKLKAISPELAQTILQEGPSALFGR